MAETPLEVKPMWSFQDVAKRFAISRSTVYRRIEQGRLRAFKVGQQLRVEPDDVDSLRRPTKGAR